MSVWTNKSSSSSTPWGVDVSDNVTSTWDTREGYDAEATQMGEVLQAAGIQGTYSSSARAAASYIGSKYKLADDRDFYFGSVDTVRMRYDTGENGLLIHTGATETTGGNLFTIKNGDTTLFAIDSSGVSTITYGLNVPDISSTNFTELNSLPVAVEGSMVYVNNEFYLAKGE